MGRDAKKKAEVRHVRKLFGGVMSAEDVHRSVALPGKKCPCGMQAAIRCRFFAKTEDVLHKSPEFLINMAAQHDGQVPVMETKYGKMIRISDAFACDICRPALEKEAAKAPSWVLVDWDFGPGKDKPIVAVG